MLKIDKILGFALGALFVSHLSFSQVSLSTYSSLGIGDLQSQASANLVGRGSVGLSKGETWYLNSLNPALLTFNVVTVYQAGFLGEYKTVRQDDLKEENGAVNLNYFATAFPLKPGKWTLGVGLNPYSRVNYNFETVSPFPGANADLAIKERGTGGFNQFYLANGFRLFNKLNVGVKASYLFSSIKKETSNTVQIPNAVVPFNTVLQERVSISDIMLSGGVAYQQKLGEKLQLNLGFTYDTETVASATKFEQFELRNIGGQIQETDTIADNIDGSITLPAKAGLGISINNGFLWTAGIDVTMQDWSDFSNFEGQNDGLDRSYTINIGGDITPDPSNVDSYLARVTYRFGVNYENTPFVVNGEQLKEFGINFGWSLPVSRLSSLDMAFRYGRRGNTGNSLIQENFFRVFFGMTFNDRWFIKRKFD